MGNPFVHIELNSGDLAKSKKFYKGLFQWDMKDMPMGPGMTYTTIGVGKGVGGGMQASQWPNNQSLWLPYVEVADVRKTIAKAEKTGAQILIDHMDVPGMGALGVFIDPNGAALGVWQPAPPARKSAKKGAKKSAKKAAKKSAKKKR